MAQKRVDPLDWRTPVVDGQGRPTAEFQRKWEEQHSINGDVPTDGPSTSKMLDYLGKTVGALLIRGATLWGLLVPVAANRVLKDNGIGNAPSWDTLSNVIDGAVGSTRGSILIRGATGWTLLTPGTADYLLKTGGAGADPSWTAQLAAANPSATAKDTAINGTAATFMRSDAAPAVQKGSATQFGIVKVDGTTITETGGIISASASGSTYTLPTASTTVLGGVKVDGTTITIAAGVISSAGGGSGNTYGLGLPLVTGETSGVVALIADDKGRTIGTLDGEAAYARLFRTGLFSARPASLTPATGAIACYLASDTGKMYLWTGAAYVALN